MELGVVGKVFLTGLLSSFIGGAWLEILDIDTSNIYSKLIAVVLFWGGLIAMIITTIIGIWRM